MDASQAKKLREPFPPGQIGKLPKGGTMLDFVGHAAVTDRLLQVDPEWTWEPMAFTAEGLPARDVEGNLWIKLTIAGVTRPGVGDGKNAKECISDAIRNAAMRFGVALDLWSREDLQHSAGEPEPQHGSAAAVQGPAVSQADAAAAEPASPAEESFAEKAERAQKAGEKATKAQLAEIESLVDVCAAARGKTSDDIWQPLANDGYALDTLSRDKAEELIGKLNRWAATLSEAAA